jgi:hypothetical protein
VPPTGFGFCELSSMHNESVFANFAVFNVQPRFSVVLPPGNWEFISTLFCISPGFSSYADTIAAISPYLTSYAES